ncbi:MAG: triose-phosphate isomerase [Planctomycetes bacterium]|nr:triose-phosphate isomerase [Planctomycetota bacterium]
MSPKKQRVPLIAGNWKMHKTLEESRDLAEKILASLERQRPYRIGLFPTAVSLAAVASAMRDSPAVIPGDLVGAQNMHFEAQGAFTGEISAEMIRGAGGDAVILGHSERRHVFGEKDDQISRKVARAIEAGITPILCVGEQLEERDAGRTMEVVKTQLDGGLSLVKTAADLSGVIIAYEPVWAIGTGRTATPEQAQEVHEFIRGELERIFSALGASADSAQETLILYGGSVKPDNAADLLARRDIDGALVGGASLKAESFLGICAGCKE